jgi:hypothetical protein
MDAGVSVGSELHLRSAWYGSWCDRKGCVDEGGTQVSEMMDLNKLITERYGGVEMSGGNDYQRASTAQMTSQRVLDSGFRVGVIKAKFESLYFAA